MPSRASRSMREVSISGLDRMTASTRVVAAMRRYLATSSWPCAGLSTMSISSSASRSPEPGDELDIMRIEEEVAVGLQHGADGTGAPGGEPPCADVRPVVEAAGGLEHALARRLAHFRIAVERPADRRLGKPQPAGELLELHVGEFLPAIFKCAFTNCMQEGAGRRAADPIPASANRWRPGAGHDPPGGGVRVLDSFRAS